MKQYDWIERDTNLYDEIFEYYLSLMKYEPLQKTGPYTYERNLDNCVKEMMEVTGCFVTDGVMPHHDNEPFFYDKETSWYYGKPSFQIMDIHQLMAWRMQNIKND